MTTGDHRGQLAMAVIEAAIAAMVILAVLGAFVGVPVVEPATETGLDATASTIITALDEQPHRGAVDALCDADDAQARSQVGAALTAMLRPGLSAGKSPAMIMPRLRELLRTGSSCLNSELSRLMMLPLVRLRGRSNR